MSDILLRRIKPSSDAVDSEVGDETVVLHLKSGTYFGLDPVGTRIWDLLKQGLSPDAICATLAKEYDVEREIIDADARRFLDQLDAYDMIVDG